MDRTHISSIKRNYGVEDVYPFHKIVNVKIKNKNDSITMIDGISNTDYSKFISLNYIGDLEEGFRKLQDDRGIILTSILKKRYGVNIGDQLILEMPEGDRIYKVVGFAETMMNAGGYALIGERYFKMDTGQQYYSNAYVNTINEVKPAEVKESLRKKFKDNNPNIQTLIEYKEGFEQGHTQMKSMLLGFTALALIIGIIGVVNNLIISFIERKRSIAVLKSIGMSKKQVAKMIFIEALSMGMIGSIVGIVGGSMLVNVVPMTLEAMKLAMPIRHMTELFPVFILSGIIMTIISSIIPALKSSKLNIIGAIKYE
jgi:putative ABC transport system permease protein